MQDTATQAMTEVALGLSMAFFALLILALISVSMPSQKIEHLSSEQSSEQSLDQNAAARQQVSLVASSETKEIDQGSSQQDPSQDRAINPQREQTIILHWQGKFVDLDNQVLELATVTDSKPVIVAVSKQTNLQELMAIQAQLQGYDVKLTQLSEEWELTLKNRQSW